MSSMHRDHTRAVIEARLSAARDQQFAAQFRRAARAERNALRSQRRAERLARRTARVGAFRRWWARQPGDGVTAVPAPIRSAAGAEDVSAELTDLLGRLADRIVEHGTVSERVALHSVADASRWTAPGAAAALVDWDCAEVLRLRAFGVLHGVVMGVLGPEDQAWLLDQLRGVARPGQGDLVA
jgi:hypothetical protein